MGSLYRALFATRRKLQEGNYPAGAEHDPNAPWNQSDPKYSRAITPSKVAYNIVGFYDGELAILQDAQGKKYSFYFGHLSNSDFEPYAEREETFIGKDEDGDPMFDYSDDWEVNEYVVSNYINDKVNSLSKGLGIESWEDGIDIVEIDEPLKQEILNTYGSNATIQNALK